MTHTPDDPRLTAYALGELDEADCAEIESLLVDSEPARRFVADLRATVAVLQDELALEPSAGLDDARREAIVAEETDAVLRLHDDSDPEAEEHTDIYHVITHPGSRDGRYRRELFAIAAGVAIVATLLTLILSSAFRNRGSNNGTVANRTGGSPQIPLPFPMPMNQAKPPEVAEHFTSRSPRELVAPDLADEPLIPFGIRGAIGLAPSNSPTTNESIGESDPYAVTIENPFFDAARNPLSSFTFGTGSASYAKVRRALAAGQLPPKDVVRIEQLINFFPFDYAPPSGDDAFAAHIEVAACPWSPLHRLVRIGLKGKELADGKPIADDLHIRVEFNPATVGAYRLIGYDRRVATSPTVNNPKRNQVTSGQAVTALYEIIPPGSAIPLEPESLRYQKPAELTAAAKSNELLTVELRYVDESTKPRSQTFAAADNRTAAPSEDFKFAAAVAGFGLILRDSPHKGDATYDIVLALAREGQHADLLGERAKFIELVQQAKRL